MLLRFSLSAFILQHPAALDGVAGVLFGASALSATAATAAYWKANDLIWSLPVGANALDPNEVRAFEAGQRDRRNSARKRTVFALILTLAGATTGLGSLLRAFNFPVEGTICAGVIALALAVYLMIDSLRLHRILDAESKERQRKIDKALKSIAEQKMLASSIKALQNKDTRWPTPPRIQQAIPQSQT